MEQTSDKSVSIFFVIDGLKLEAQAALLACSLRHFNKERYKLIAYVPPQAKAQIQRITLRVMNACDVELRPLEQRQVLGRPTFTEHYPHGNKILAAADDRDTDVSVFLDSDMFCCAPLDFEDLVTPGTMRAVVSDYATGWYSQKRWKKAYHAFGLELPEQRVQFHRGRRLLSPPYYNAGMIGFPENVDSEDQHLGKVWLETANRFDWDVELKYERVFLDQLTLPIAATRAGLAMPLTPTDYNLNIMRRPFDPAFTPKILHYHRFKDLWAWPSGKEVFSIVNDTIGTYLAKRVFRVFRQQYLVPPGLHAPLRDQSETAD